MTLAPLRVREAADSMAKASTPEPFSSSRTSNWVARSGGLPPYVQHIAHDIMEKRGKSESEAIQIAIGVVRRWARGGGNVDAGTRAAAAKAVAEWEAKKAGAHAKSAVKEGYVPTWSEERAVRDAALTRLAMFEQTIGLDGVVGLLAEGALAESAAFSPTLKRTASASNEVERHEVYDGGQHVGTIARQRGYGPSEPDRHVAFAVNGTRVSGYREGSRQGALDALKKHLEEAPARVVAGPGGKHLVATPESYGASTTYKAFSDHGAARYAAGLPPAPTSPEVNSKVEAMAEALRFDLLTVAHLEIPPLAGLQEAASCDPLALLEAFNAGELRGVHGKWVAGGSHRLTPRSLPGRSTRRIAADAPRGHRKSEAQTRYEGGVVRASAKLRAAHAAKPQIALEDLAGAVGSHPEGDKASRRLIAQKQVGSAGELERGIKAGTHADTEQLHRTGPNGEFSKERQALHEQIISALLQGKGVHEGKARAIFTAGGPASGKSGIVATGESHGFEKHIAGQKLVQLPPDVVHANPDVVREMLPEYKALKAAGRADAANLTHEEASLLAKRVTRVALGHQHHILVDTVGDSGEGKFAGKVQDALDAGHTVSVHYATVPVDEAIKRADKRGERTGRFVVHDYLRDAHQQVSKRFPEVAKMKGVHVQVFDTTSKPSRLIAEKHPGSDNIHIGDARAFQAFRDKAKG